MATIKFLGAAQEVTGSCHLVSAPGAGNILLDCGMHQGGDAIERLPTEQFLFEPAEIDALVLSHAHLDHSGLLPMLVHAGFNSPIYCTKATAELLEIMLDDAAGLYMRDLERENIKRERRGQPAVEALYNLDDVKKVLGLCRGIAYNQATEIKPHISVTLHDAGHILGSAIVQLDINERGQQKRVVFSGDLGKKDSPLMKDPTLLTEADVVLMESTYGNRDHRTMDDSILQLEQVLHETWEAGGNVLIPAFAVGRTQEFLFYLGRMHQEGKLDGWQIFLDSPMAIKVTKVYDRWLHTMDCEDVKALCERDRSFLKDFLPRLIASVSSEESMAINRIKSGALIIAGSGMCTGGRIRHHFKHRIWDKRTTIIFAGFQARGTLGRMLVDGMKKIKLFGDEFLVRARIETIGGFSAHAGQAALVNWSANFSNQPKIFLVHGEPEAQDALAEKLYSEKGISVTIPALRQSFAF
ncbi:MBL fold metallo-hydrolase [Simiduia curdlanivorans]|uniref:MBL fold metallo-hydrolase RNA specificity domain-containing protein n=1 Tax=Simiduia curdlanivorans TaxID=1492769 RepID=A0ABV8V9E5_9GAMM|nr:MBL fold metallo-hydrolase [Simiduia curdlanivorans]MDN3638697.1 MBL fold metallo-hydrolase [Simiduia curdlanivorans]